MFRQGQADETIATYFVYQYSNFTIDAAKKADNIALQDSLNELPRGTRRRRMRHEPAIYIYG